MRAIVTVVTALAFLLCAVPVMAADSMFDQAKACIESWKAPSCMGSICGKPQAARSTTAAAPAPQVMKMDALGNKVPSETAKSGNVI